MSAPKCSSCKKRAVFVKKRGLCKACYQADRKERLGENARPLNPHSDAKSLQLCERRIELLSGELALERRRRLELVERLDRGLDEEDAKAKARAAVEERRDAMREMRAQGMTLDAIGQTYGISRQRVEQLVKVSPPENC